MSRLLTEWDSNPNNAKKLNDILNTKEFRLAVQILSKINLPKGIVQGDTAQDALTSGALKMAWLGGFNDFVNQLEMFTKPLPKPQEGVPEAWGDTEYIQNWYATNGFTK